MTRSANDVDFYHRASAATTPVLRSATSPTTATTTTTTASSDFRSTLTEAVEMALTAVDYGCIVILARL